MLVISRRESERLLIGEHGEIEIMVLSIEHRKVRLGITAKRDVPIWRAELLPEKRAKIEAAQ